MTSHRIKDRRKPVRSGVLVCVFSIAVTFQNISLAGLPLMDDLVHANTECCVLLRPLGTKPLVLNHIGPTTKIKWDQSREVGISSGNQALTRCAFVGTDLEKCRLFPYSPSEMIVTDRGKNSITASEGERPLRIGFFAVAHRRSLRIILYTGAVLVAATTLTVGIGLIRSR
jgi:hypothetical protein